MQANILVSDDGRPLITDLGVSTVSDVLAKMTNSTEVHCAWRWRAPELFLPSHFGVKEKITGMSDVYAFGMTCLEVRAFADPLFLRSSLPTTMLTN